MQITKTISFILKLIISGSILLGAHFALNSTSNVNRFEYSSSKASKAIPPELTWYDPFRGIENLPTKK